MKKEKDETGSPEKIDGENSGTAMRSLACGTPRESQGLLGSEAAMKVPKED